MKKGRVDGSDFPVIDRTPMFIPEAFEFRTCWRELIRVEAMSLNFPIPPVAENIVREDRGGKKDGETKKTSRSETDTQVPASMG